MSLNLSTSCRCCLNSEDGDVLVMSDNWLFDESTKSGHNLKIIDSYFEFCVDPATASLGSFNICAGCRRILQTFAAFREQCRINNALFQNQLVKTETAGFNVIVNEIKVSTQHSVTEVLITEVKSEPPSEDEWVNDKNEKSEPPSEDEEDVPLAKRYLSKRLPDSEPLEITPTIKLEIDGQQPLETKNASFLCFYCDERHSSCDSFRLHLRKRARNCTINGINKCGICGERSIKNYAYHLHSHHPTYTPQQCLICSEKFITPVELLNHMGKHRSPDYTYKCHGTACGKWFTSNLALRNHIESFEHNPATPKRSPILTFNCPICGLTAALQALVQHIRSEHSKELTHKYYPCYACRRIFLLCTDYDKHVQKGCRFKVPIAGKQKGTAVQQCGKCDFECADDEELLCHEIVKHNVEEETFRCDFCPELFPAADDLVRHNRMKHRACPLDATHICEQCGRGFANGTKYKAHVVMHSEIRRYPCDHCAASYRTRPELDRHKTFTHGQTVKHFECHECGAKEFLLSALKHHLLCFHFKALRPMVCPVCNRRFIKTRDLKRHQVSHTGVKKFACVIEGCGKRYLTKTGLLNHVQTNHTLVRYECKFCDKKLATKLSMWKHIFVHRGFFPFNCQTCNYGCYPRELMKTHLKKHNIEFNDAIHGYHAETVDQVLASGTKISEPDNITFFLNPENSTVEKRMSDLMQHETFAIGRRKKGKTSEENAII